MNEKIRDSVRKSACKEVCSSSLPWWAAKDTKMEQRCDKIQGMRAIIYLVTQKQKGVCGLRVKVEKK